MLNKDELIEKYLEGTLNTEENMLFHQLMKEDSDFKEEVTFQLKTRQAFKNIERASLKEMLSQLDESTHSIAKPKKEPIYQITYYVAAGLIALLGLSFVFKWFTDNQPKDVLAYYEPYPNVITPTTRNATEDSLNLAREALIAYENESYEKADSLFNQVKYLQLSYTAFYKGIIKIELQSYDSASFYFAEYLESGDSVLYQQSLWYKFISEYAAKDTSNAKATLELLSKYPYKQEEVRVLLNQIK
ncbi:hypothetical protein [Penaeicola halotolerans]|uniref:hypothetical protein n=1 Tax=Penaeicola halotolerans TaxID=2793196 RepID=UPI001CF8BC7D|nr:hypothetical protein [Penaeicola halotolerans]